MKKEVYIIEDAKTAHKIKESLEDKKAISKYFLTGDKTEVDKRGIRFAQPL